MFDLVGCDVQNLARDGRNVTVRRSESFAVPQGWTAGVTAWRTATTDYIFRMARPLLLNHACKLRARLFGPAGAPPNTILVHIRWGDKGVEMRLKPIRAYVTAVQQIVTRHKLSKVTVLLISEDPKAWAAFQGAKRPEWRTVHMAKLDRSKLALEVLALVYVGLEARFYVLTRGSNWSRLYDELRRSRTDVLCGNCTTMIDLHPREV